MVNRKFYIILVLAAVSALLLYSVALGEELPGSKVKQPQSLSKGTGDPKYQVLSINNLTTWTRYDGGSNHAPSGNDGVTYPAGTETCVYEDGFVFGGKIFTNAALTTRPTVQPIRINGSTYSASTYVGIRGGWVNGFGATAVPVSPNDAGARCYRVRRDYTSMSETEYIYDAQTYYEQASPSAVTATMISAIKQQYDTDWKNWPVNLGAPYIERNGVPGYQAPPAFSETFTPDDLLSGKYDEPGVAGADPNSPADQVIFLVYNDLDNTQSVRFVGSQPLGIEIQKTIWGYKRTDAMGNIYFTRYRMINKGGVDVGGGVKGSFWVDSMYVCQWSDIDMGNAGDDLVGSDSTMNLMYVYNGNPVDTEYQRFGLPPPAPGYSFLAGPQVVAPGDSAIFNFKRVQGKKNLPMSSCVYFSAGSTYSDPPGGSANYLTGTYRWYAMLQGYAPLGQFGDSYSRYRVPPGVDPNTKYMLSGDPVARTGFLDGLGTDYSYAPGDRRILLNSGPFTFAPGDTNETYMGFVVGMGADRFSSISVMKFNYRFVNNTFKALFQVPKAPPSVRVSVAELDEKVILDWGADATSINNIENKFTEPGHYRFEGYNVYQFPASGSTLADGVRLATYDTDGDPAVVTDLRPVSGVVVSVPVQFGTNSGLQRQYVLDKDKVNDLEKLYNGREYYIAVTAYSVATVEGFLPSCLESTPIIMTVVPKSGPFGMKYATTYGDTIKPVTKNGASDGFVVPLVINPTVSTGHIYRVNFDTTGGFDSWRVTDVTLNKLMVSGVTDQKADALSPTIDGIQVRVSGAPNDSKDYLHVQNPSGKITPPTYAAFASWNSLGFPCASGTEALSGGGPSIGDWGDNGRWGIHTGGGSNTGASSVDAKYSTRFLPRTFRNDNFTRFVPYDFEIRFTAAGGKANTYFNDGKTIDVPFELWNIGINTPDNPSDDFRMIPLLNDEDGSGTFNLMKYDHGLSGGDNDPYTDWIYWYDPVPKAPGHAGYDAFVAAGAAYDGSQGTGDEVMARMVLVNVNGGSISATDWPANLTSKMPKTGNVIRILSTKPNSPAVNFTYTAPLAEQSADLAKASIDKISVFPNPYYAINNQETSRFVKFIQFTNMPPVATIRIFNLAGQLVTILQKNDQSTFFRWDLGNNVAYPVASGMYIAYIEIPDAGTKVLKMAIIQEQEMLEIY